MQTFLILWGWLNLRKKKQFFLIIFFTIILTLLEGFGLALVVPLIGSILNSEESFGYFSFFYEFINLDLGVKDQQLTFIIAIFFIIFLLKNIFSIFTNFKIHQYVNETRTLVSLKILKKYINQKFTFFLENPIENLNSTFIQEINYFSNYYFRPLLILLSEIFVLFALLVVILLLGHLNVLMIILPAIVILSLVLKFFNKTNKKQTIKRINLDRDISAYTMNFFLSIKEIILSGNTQIINNFEKTFNSREDINSRQSSIMYLPRSILEITIILIFCSVIMYFDYIDFSTNQIIVSLSLYFAAAYRALPSINKIFSNYQQIKIGRISLININNILNLSDFQFYYLRNEEKQKLEFKKNIKFHNVSFSFENKKIFKNLNIEINKNSIVGILGKSGSGKSTFLNIFSQLLDVKNGKVFIDDKVIIDQKMKRALQDKISFISQDTFLLNDTIKNNIHFGLNTEFDLIKFNNALKFSNSYDFVNSLKNGINTSIGINSRFLSSGQKQRICLARLHYNMREILIFDEVTNALDIQNENSIIKKIIGLKKENKTIILVSHNKNILDNCDVIYSVENETMVKIK